jgi:hypothetical protein
MSLTAHLPRTALLDKLWARMNERGDFPLLSESLRTTMAAMKNDELDFTALVRVVLSISRSRRKCCGSRIPPCTWPSAATSRPSPER